MRVPLPRGGQSDNITFRHPSDAGGTQMSKFKPCFLLSQAVVAESLSAMCRGMFGWFWVRTPPMLLHMSVSTWIKKAWLPC